MEHLPPEKTLAKLASQFAGSGFRELVQEHVNRQNKVQLATALKGFERVMPREHWETANEILDQAYHGPEGSRLWERDCGVVFRNVCESARRILAGRGCDASESDLFAIFQAFVLHWAFGARTNRRFRKVLGIRRTFFFA